MSIRLAKRLSGGDPIILDLDTGMQRQYRYIRALWAKKPHDASMRSLSLFDHLCDTAAMAKKLWHFRVSKGNKNYIADACCTDIDGAGRLFVFLAAVHDIGKATPAFQSKTCIPANDLDDMIREQTVNMGMEIKDGDEYPFRCKTPHTLAGERLLRTMGCLYNIASIIGAHHGKPTEDNVVNEQVSYPSNYGTSQHWRNAQAEVLALALELSGFDDLHSVPIPSQPAQVLLTALVIMADWMSSNEKAFPYFEAGCTLSIDEQRRRADLAWEHFSLQAPAPRDDSWIYSDLYMDRFCFDANPMQLKVAESLCAQTVPSLMIIEAPMGQGKT